MKPPASIPPSSFFDDEDIKYRLRFKIEPRAAFVRRTLDVLDESEKNIRQKEKEETDKAEKRAKDPKNLPVISSPLSVLREEYRVILPLHARYAALISAVAGLEWLVSSLHAAHIEDLTEFAQHEKNSKYRDGDAAANQRFEEMQKIIKRDRKIGRGRVEETLRRMAKEWAQLREKKRGEEIFSDLRVVRHAIVHCGGAVQEFNDPDKLRKAIDRLDKFYAVAEEVEVDDEKFIMPLSESLPEEQIWIERNALRPLVEQALDFIMQVRAARSEWLQRTG